MVALFHRHPLGCRRRYCWWSSPLSPPPAMPHLVCLQLGPGAATVVW
jgi:hypothetical protein